MSWCAHQKADMKSCLPHSPPVLNIPAMLSELFWVRFLGLSGNILVKKVAVLKLEAESIIT